MPLLPLQLLWINLLTDGMPAIALGLDTPDPTLMRRPPRRAGERLLHARRLLLLTGRGLLLATAALSSAAIARFVWDLSWSHARAVMFTVLVTAHLLYAFAVSRPPGKPAIDGGRPQVGSNRALLLAVGVSFLLQVGVVLLPPARSLLGVVPLSGRDWTLVAVASALPLALMTLVRPRPARKPRTLGSER